MLTITIEGPPGSGKTLCINAIVYGLKDKAHITVKKVDGNVILEQITYGKPKKSLSVTIIERTTE
jgi:Ni2+-binding GTPase involved in maturation of urease and hydrogenase